MRRHHTNRSVRHVTAARARKLRKLGVPVHFATTTNHGGRKGTHTLYVWVLAEDTRASTAHLRQPKVVKVRMQETLA